MRIVHEITHPRMKITIFKMNDKLSLKFEKKMLEQIYKFRDGSPLHNLDILIKLCDSDFMLNVEKQFNEMMKNRDWAMTHLEEEDNSIDEII